MARKKCVRNWTAGAAAMLGLAPIAALALDAGGAAVYSAAVPPPPGCAAPGMKPIGVPLEPQAETMKGAPYSAVGTTEVVRTLADGNRITHTNTMRYFRDSAGRTRTEYQLGAIGPFVPDEAQSIVTITDPVAGKRYVLSPAKKRADVFDLSAEKGAQARTGKAIIVNGTVTSIGAQALVSPAPVPTKGFQILPRSGRGPDRPTTIMAQGFAPAGGVPEAGVSISGAPQATSSGPARSDVFFVQAGPAVGVGCAAANGKAAPQAVSIGERRIEGLKVTGSRLEFTIDAGEVGNEQPITVRTDQWFSPELGVVVASTNSDPTIGETTYRLEQINRSEPDASLFTVPADFAKSSADR